MNIKDIQEAVENMAVSLHARWVSLDNFNEAVDLREHCIVTSFNDFRHFFKEFQLLLGNEITESASHWKELLSIEEGDFLRRGTFRIAKRKICETYPKSVKKIKGT